MCALAACRGSSIPRWRSLCIQRLREMKCKQLLCHCPPGPMPLHTVNLRKPDRLGVCVTNPRQINDCRSPGRPLHRPWLASNYKNFFNNICTWYVLDARDVSRRGFIQAAYGSSNGPRLTERLQQPVRAELSCYRMCFAKASFCAAATSENACSALARVVAADGRRISLRGRR